MKPRAKSDGLLTEQLEDELIVFDKEHDRGHCLNRTAALVWRNADGKRTIADLAALLRSELDPLADEDLVFHALDRLDSARLLAEPLGRSNVDMRTSRRNFVAKVGFVGVASLLLPLVTSITAPAPAQAQSCGCGSGGAYSQLFALWLAQNK